MATCAGNTVSLASNNTELDIAEDSILVIEHKISRKYDTNVATSLYNYFYVNLRSNGSRPESRSAITLGTLKI